MADNADAQQQPPPSTGGVADDSEPTVTFKVKTSSDTAHAVTLPLSATVAELKTQLSSPEFENVPIDRQRLIYSGRVLKNDDTLGSYRIKDGNTVHMVKSAASNVQNQNQSGSGAGASGGARVSVGSDAGTGADATGTTARSGAAAQGVPSNMAAGTANDLLAGLTGARFAGMGLGLPGREMFGPDGLGPPANEEDMLRMMEDPSYRQMMNEALDDPRVVDLVVQSSPMLRDLPNARELLQSPMMRSLFTNPNLMRGFSNMRRTMGGGGGNEAFPAPGATDTTPSGAPASGGPGNSAGNDNATGTTAAGTGGAPLIFAGLPMFPSQGAGAQGAGAQGAGGQPSNPFASLLGGAGVGTGAEAGSGAGVGADNPFAALFAQANQGQGQAPRFPPLDPTLMTQMLQALGGNPGAGAGAGASAGGPPNDFLSSLLGGGGGAPQQQDNSPPEERYESQLRQLNDMGFVDFDRNVTALRRSGGSVQGAIEYLLGPL